MLQSEGIKMLTSPERLRAKDIQRFLLETIPTHPTDIIPITMQYFNISRMTVHRHLKALQQQNKIIQNGKTHKTHYTLNTLNELQLSLKLTPHLQETNVLDAYLSNKLDDLSKSVRFIVEFGFTEMLNNVIDHSQAKSVDITFKRNENLLTLIIQDNGVGVFSRIQKIFHFENYHECLLHLSKGKLTTDPTNHTGEGIFFSSRGFDEFYLEANGLCFYRNNIENDWSLQKSDVKKGSKITMKVDVNSKRVMREIFDAYTEDDDDHAFIATDLLVNLSQYEGERLISRSQAKRLLARLTSFTRLMLDFATVESVGQGFVDEMFRVYPSKNPNVSIFYKNANPEVEFMIKRGLPHK